MTFLRPTLRALTIAATFVAVWHASERLEAADENDPIELFADAEDEPAVAEIPRIRKRVVPAAAGDIPRLIADLNHVDASVREQATERLAASGKPAVEALAKAARSGELETRVRAVAAMRLVLRDADDDDEAIDAADTALVELSAAGGASVASRAIAALSDNSPARERRALKAIEELGGIITYASNQFGEVEEDDDGRVRRQVSHIVVGKDWKGGDEGLKHVRRLPNLKMFYYIAESGVTDEGLKSLQSAIPGLDVQRRARSCLGVAGGTAFNGRGCYVQRVVPDSAADKAGIESNDTILSFDGRPVADFPSLIEFIGSTKPGDKIKVEIERNGKPQQVVVVMGEWKQ